jgi:signal transduction histidine kinase
MKLIRKTINQIGLALIPVMILGTVFINYTIRWIAYQEADDYLAYEMNRVQRVFDRIGEIPQIYTIHEISVTDRPIAPFFKDTLVEVVSDADPERYRELLFTLNTQDGEYVAVVLRQITLSQRDIARGSVFIIMGLLLLMTITILIVVNIQAERIWTPFFRTLGMLRKYRVQDDPPDFERTDVHEFRMLNQTVRGMLQKMSGDYQRVKECNENISHELQTHLAVIKTANEELINHFSGNEASMEQSRRAYVAATKLSHIHKSLLLLSKIGNKEFDTTSLVRPADILKQALADFDELIQLREIRVETSIRDNRIRMDYGLAVVLITNLVKNAVKHNLDGGTIRITYEGTVLEVVNTGKPYAGNPESLLQRFIRGEDGNTGLGLAITRQICDSYGFSLSYTVDGQLHCIRIDFAEPAPENLQN